MADQPTDKFTVSDRNQILLEAVYLLAIVVVVLPLLVFVWWFPETLNLDVADTGTDTDTDTGLGLRVFALVSLAGALGGTAFAMKWLHHAVGLGPAPKDKDKAWTRYQALWRFFVPILGFIMAGAFYAALKSGLFSLQVSDKAEIDTFAVAFGFIVGYFSDRASAKLKEVAYVLFGKTDEKELEGQ